MRLSAIILLCGVTGSMSLAAPRDKVQADQQAHMAVVRQWARSVYLKQPTFAQTMSDARAAMSRLGKASPADAVSALADLIQKDFPVQWDWALQDHGLNFAAAWFSAHQDAALERALLDKALGRSPNPALRRDYLKLTTEATPAGDPRWLDLYVRACEIRRAARLAPLIEKTSRMVFTKHFNLGGSHYAYTEAQSDAQAERNFRPGASLCLLEVKGLYGEVLSLLEDRNGVIRDPDVSHDGSRILFSWKKDDRKDDYHLYEMEVGTGKVRQLTDGLGFADYEGQYLPGGDIIFNSTRPVQTVDCWWTEVSNLYSCDKDGRFLRRLTFDQVHDNYPTVTPDGRVLYTRWEYNDRGQIYPQPLYQMFPDGTGQTEFYGNNSWFPTTILHARGLPGSTTVLAIASGHHCWQAGKLIVIDPARGQQEDSGIIMAAPLRPAKAEKIDAYGQAGELFQYPYPLDDNHFLVAYTPTGWNGGPRGDRHATRFGIYLMDLSGQRELLVADPAISCNQPIPLAARPAPPVRPSAVDYSRKSGSFYVQDVYAGPGLAGVPRGTIKSLRVVTIQFRAAGIGHNNNGGPAGGALVSTPVGVNNASWDVKVVLGDAKVHEDGSAYFRAPARTPVYFQMLDEKGRMVQTMRSWATLQPGENASCVGCHEEKSTAPLARSAPTQALAQGTQELKPFYGPPRGFSFAREIQPILDQHCVSCHNDRSMKWDATAVRPPSIPPSSSNPQSRSFSLLAEPNHDQKAARYWSDAYLALTAGGMINPWVNWPSAQSIPPMLPPYFAGSTQSKLLTLLENGHYDVKLTSEQYHKLACWIDLLVPFCGDYTEAAAWSDQEKEKYRRYLDKRTTMEAQEARNVQALVEERRRGNPGAP